MIRGLQAGMQGRHLRGRWHDELDEELQLEEELSEHEQLSEKQLVSVVVEVVEQFFFR
jgi:hypothetical protein